jgi:HEPN domain-containing protein
MNEEQEWLKKAKRDFKAAKINFREELYDISAFLLHQCVEKLLKADRGRR